MDSRNDSPREASPRPPSWEKSPLPVPASMIFTIGAAIGIAGDILLRSPGDPGLNMALVIMAGVAATIALQRRASHPLSREAQVLLAATVAFAMVIAWRDAPFLKLIAVAGAAIAFSLAAFRSGVAWLRRASVGDCMAAFFGTAVHAGFGGFRALARIDRAALHESTTHPRTRNTLAVVRGVILAVPLIIVFGALFMAADAVFEQIATDMLRIDLPTVASHIVLASVLAWIATGSLTGFLLGTRRSILHSGATSGASGDASDGGSSSVVRSMVGVTEVGVVLSLLVLLFGAFVLVQFRYLFGGGAMVEVTPGLTYAEYARRGFFELVAVVALILPVLLAADWVLHGQQRGERMFRVLAGVQIALVLVIAASALQRMRLYVDAYGLTEDRLYVAAMLILAAVILFWFAATVLRGRRDTFAVGGVVATLVAGAVLITMNPDALIVRTNVEHAATRGTEASFDVVYATSLSADAVPTLIATLPAIAPQARCNIAKQLLRRWPPDRAIPMRSWNWSVARAQKEVRRVEVELRSLAATC